MYTTTSLSKLAFPSMGRRAEPLPTTYITDTQGHNMPMLRAPAVPGKKDLLLIEDHYAMRSEACGC